MKKIGLVIFLMVSLSLLSACQGPSEPTSPTQPANPTATAAGQQLYKTNCSSCHGPNGAGGLKIGEATSADIRAQALNEMYKGDWSLAKRAILTGKDEDGEDLNTVMPRWSGKLSDAEVNAIVQYLQTLK